MSETVEGHFWKPLDANFTTSKKCSIPIQLFIREEIESPTEQELELEKEFVDPELEVNADLPKEEESKQPEGEEENEEPPVQELKFIQTNFDLKLVAGRK